MRSRFFLCLIIAAAAGCGRTPPQALGTLEWDRVNGRALVSEVITDIYVREGNVVAAGSPLLKLDDRKIRAEVDSVKGKLQQAEWALKERIAGPRPQTIAEERARVASAQADVVNTRNVYERRKNLYIKKHTSKEDLEQARKDFQSAQARLKERSEALAELLAGTRVEQVEQSRAQVVSLKSELAQLNLKLADYTVKAARRGRVDSLPFKLGDRPPVNAVVATLLSGEKPWARIYVPEPYRSKMTPGETYRVQIDGQMDTFTARLRTISSEASFTPYYALSEKDRSRLVYVAELDLLDDHATRLTAGTPVQLLLEDL